MTPGSSPAIRLMRSLNSPAQLMSEVSGERAPRRLDHDFAGRAVDAGSGRSK